MKLDWGLVLGMSLGLILGCISDDDSVTPVGTFDNASDFMVESGLNLPALLADWLTPASSVVDTNDGMAVDYTALDIRSASDFALDHISGAINTMFGGFLAAVEGNAADPSGYLVVCVAGQTAGPAAEKPTWHGGAGYMHVEG